LKNKGFKDESMTKGGSYAIGRSTTLESNKSLPAHHGTIFHGKQVAVERMGHVLAC
jgi:hypothetical protein